MRAVGFPAFPPTRRKPTTWWGRQWVRGLEDAALDEGQLKKGRKYASAGYVGPISLAPTHITATVRDYEDDTTYTATLRTPAFSDRDWTRFQDQVAAQAAHTAALLAGDLPHDLAGLLPDEVEPECTCPGWEHPCRHAAALAHQVAWLLDADPFLLLLLRGRDKEDLLTPTNDTDPAAQAFERPPMPLPPPPPPPDSPVVVPAIPPAEGIHPQVMEDLVRQAAHRARALLTEQPT